MKSKYFWVIIAVFLGILLVSMNSHAQEIKRIINYGWDLDNKDPYWQRQFTAQIKVDSLPELGKTTAVLVKIKCKYKTKSAPGFVIRGCDRSVDYTQLEPEWIPPIVPEDVYEGNFSITPREIGTFSFYIRAWGEGFRGNSDNGFNLYLTIDESGKAIHFSDIPHYHYEESGPPSHPLIGDNQVFIRYHPFGDFENSFRIVPPLSLNTTSTIHIELKAKRYCPEGVQLSFTLSSNLDIVTIPVSWVGEVKEGDVYKDSFMIIPTTTELAFLFLEVEGNSITKEVVDRGRATAWQEFNLHFSFGSSGKLEYAGRQGKYYRSSGGSPRKIAESLGEEYRKPKGASKTFKSKPIISIRRKR